MCACRRKSVGEGKIRKGIRRREGEARKELVREREEEEDEEAGYREGGGVRDGGAGQKQDVTTRALTVFTTVILSTSVKSLLREFGCLRRRTVGGGQMHEEAVGRGRCERLEG